jgi:hypothetical protein
VRLRRYPYDVVASGAGGGPAGASTNELFVSLDILASTILSDLASDEIADEPADSISAAASSSRDPGRLHQYNRENLPCILVEHDQYYGNDRDMYKSEVPQWKTYLKAMKNVSMSAHAYLASLHQGQIAGGGGSAASSAAASGGASSTPVFAVADASFFVLRDFGTSLMRREFSERSAIGAANETIERYPKHKRVIRTLGNAIDSHMRRQGYWSSTTSSTSHGLSAQMLSSSSLTPGHPSQPSHHHSHHGSSLSSSLVSLLLYSKVDDRFDVVTLSTSATSRNGGKRAGKS